MTSVLTVDAPSVNAVYDAAAMQLSYAWPPSAEIDHRTVGDLATNLSQGFIRVPSIEFGWLVGQPIGATFKRVQPNDAETVHRGICDCLFRVGLLDSPSLPLALAAA